MKTKSEMVEQGVQSAIDADRDRLIHILVVHFDMLRAKAEEAADLFLHDKVLAARNVDDGPIWECKDYADGWIRYVTLADALEYQEQTGCIMRPVRAALTPTSRVG